MGLPGMNSKWICSAGKNTGASLVVRAASEWVTEEICVLAPLNDAGGIEFPDENWGRSEDLKRRRKGWPGVWV